MNRAASPSPDKRPDKNSIGSKASGSKSAGSTAGGSSIPAAAAHNPNSTRETVESIAIAVVLAFLFRGFVAEAFVIPTGSMAPTLQGNHKDVVCSKCGHAYQAGASIENDDQVSPETVVATTCPICRYTMTLDWNKDANHRTFTGDRILVSKFSYEFSDPERWDVIVFKFPNNAKQNYIKRLIGLPGETVRIQHGDVYIRPSEGEPFVIARKPPKKVLAMLQVVDDTQHVPEELAQVDWPSRWQPWTPGERLDQWRSCQTDRDGLEIDAGDKPVWFRYRHLLPTEADWEAIDAGRPPEKPPVGDDIGQLITDFCPYNAYTTEEQIRSGVPRFDLDRRNMGMHWVGDLALDCELDITADAGDAAGSGVVWLDLVEAGRHFRVELELKTGVARLLTQQADGVEQELAKTEAGGSSVRGPGRHQVRFANVDDQLCLWIDDSLVLQTPYDLESDAQPRWIENRDPLDFAPAGIGGRNVKCRVVRAQLLRDVYYVATRHGLGDTDYQEQIQTPEGTEYLRYDEIPEVFSNPRVWPESLLFKARQKVEFKLGEDHFFPMGDNSPQSLDGRLWGQPAFVERHLLTGKALMVYWPHPWNAPVRFLPNVGRMRLIH